MRILSRLGSGLLAGACVGALAGWVDQLLRVLHPGLGLAQSALLGVVVLYIVPLALLGLLVAAILRGREVGVPFRGALATCIGASVLVLLGGWLNIHGAGSLTSPRALLIDAAALVAAVLAGLLLLRFVPAAPMARARGPLVVVGVLAVAVAAVVSFSSTRTSESAEVSRRNEGPDLLVVLFDALRADHTSAYGYARPTTPTLEEIAATGTRFDTVYAPSSWTKPSVATLFTGLYPASHGNHRIVSRLPPAARTVPELLREGGYHTGVFAENSFVSKLFGYDRGVDRLVGHEPDVPAQSVLGHILHQLAVRSDAAKPLLAWAKATNVFDPRQSSSPGGLDLSSAVLDFVDGVPAQERFFAYVHWMKPHAPYICPEPFDGAFGEPSGEGTDSPVDPPHVEGIAPFTRVSKQADDFASRLIANYDERILYGDHLLSELLNGLRERERDRDLVLIVIADHGEEFGEHGLWDHGHSLQEGVVRVPFLLRGPGRLGVPRVVTDPVRLLDLAPTLMELAGLDMPPEYEGKSVLGLLEGSEAVPRPALLELDHGPDFRAEALVSQGLKLVRSRDGDKRSTRLFDLRVDAKEENDLAEPGREPLIWLEPELEAALQAAARQRQDTGEATLDPETEERLRALGYIH